jgi:hypothetical protein
MSVVKYHNDHNAVKKDSIIENLIPNEITECALYLQKKVGEPCSTDETINKIAETLEINGDPNEIISAAKTSLGCNTEKCVLESLRDKIGSERVKAEINTRFKLVGPNGIELLSNFDIDDTLMQWTCKWKKFFPYNFNMINYASYSLDYGHVINKPDTLATISFSDLYYGKIKKEHKYEKITRDETDKYAKVIYGDIAKTGLKNKSSNADSSVLFAAIDGQNGAVDIASDIPRYNCGGCVINSDKYQGRGKHWMALFFDARGDEWSVEFFNSGGNGPAPEWINWVLKTCEQMKDVAAENGRRVNITPVRSSSIRHQHSKTECGLYSLFYIYARLCGVPYSYFHKNPIPDQLMFELRQHLFAAPGGHKGIEIQNGVPKFNFDKYKNEIKIEWERD